MLRLGLWQWHRANSTTGGIQNYAYAFQWPLFAVFGIVLWVKTMQDELRGRRGAEPLSGLPERAGPEAEIIPQPGVGMGTPPPAVAVDEDDREVAGWNAGLAALNAATAALES